MEQQKQTEQERRKELGNLLRTRREKLTPAMLGVPARGRRRTAGLRREEVAELIGVGVTWYTWLEQGRAIQVSVEVLENLVRVLQLSIDERLHLFQLARRPLPPAFPHVSETVRPVFSTLLTALEPSPAHIRDHRWNVLAWNRAESRLGDWEVYPAVERNVVWHHFAHPEIRRLMVNWEREARTLLALFRMESGQHLDDPWFTTLIESLKQVSAEFRHWWSLHEVQQQRELPIEFHHPDVGRLVLQPVTVMFMYDQQLFLRALLPLSETDTAAKLRHLLQGGAKHREGDMMGMSEAP